MLWSRVPETDRWSIGKAYADATASGNDLIVADLKRALLRVKGFDYVPENVRSSAYKRAAQAVVQAHFGWDNFAAEVQPTRHLASLGSVVPKPAIPEVVKALLLVYLGNQYGPSYSAVAIAEPELVRLSPVSWHYYLSQVLPNDEDVLLALMSTKASKRFLDLHRLASLPPEAGFPPAVNRLVEEARKDNELGVRSAAESLLRAFRGPTPASK